MNITQIFISLNCYFKLKGLIKNLFKSFDFYFKLIKLELTGDPNETQLVVINYRHV